MVVRCPSMRPLHGCGVRVGRAEFERLGCRGLETSVSHVDVEMQMRTRREHDERADQVLWGDGKRRVTPDEGTAQGSSPPRSYLSKFILAVESAETHAHHIHPSRLPKPSSTVQATRSCRTSKSSLHDMH
ncbi:hypothetical protein BCR34DRAFT_298726 [Clohesyomyces aquaticus]|uniref:Uncharacterized protein n=1 Tax=Clohesyomyces aquaticus TaxID=1231657 RepID=A0A1Y1ZRV8_9PLEO|nr:hypothetical protein BCR34DRAFT_298726 [Clohesyomyces aquaticus]